MKTSNSILFSATIFALMFNIVYCQVPAPGKCPSGIETISEFNVAKYLGTWYEHSKYPAIFEVGGKCIQAVYGTFENGSVSVTNTQVNKVIGSTSTIEGNAELTDESGKLVVKFPSVGKVGIKSNYWVLDTDYTSYSVVYSCNEHLKNMMHSTIMWILTRERNPSQDVIDKAYKVFDDNKLSKTFLVKTDQEDC